MKVVEFMMQQTLQQGMARKKLELCALMQVAMIAASCTPPAPGADPELVGGDGG